jgi:mRNA-degrading endonuclease HigB of HigAB toxin-antitoxin module
MRLMTLIGRSEIDQSKHAGPGKERLALWLAEVAAADWANADQLRSEYPNLVQFESGEFCFPFPEQMMSVIARIAFKASVVSITTIRSDTNA